MANTRHIKMEMHVVPERHSLRATVTHYLTPIDKPLARVSFNLCELTVDSVKVGGRDTRFHHEGGVLEVFLSPPAQPGREVEVGITYHGSPRTGLNFTGPDRAHPQRLYQAWSQGQDEYARYWWPSHDYPNLRATTEMVVTAPGRYEVVSNGRLVSVTKNRDLRIWHWLQEVPHVAYLVSLVVGEFDHWTEEREGLPPLEYYVPPGRRKDGERTFARTAEMVRTFEEFTGEPYPYPRYAQVVVEDFTWGGMENTSATTLTDMRLLDERAAPDYDSDYLVSHELAHQWFGDLLTCREWAHAWLNEGFATFCQQVWTERRLGEDEAQQQRLEDLEKYLEEEGEYLRPLVSRDYFEPVALFDTHLYEKGGLVLWMLRNLLGDETFRRGVRAYVERHKMGLVGTEDLVRALEDVSGKSLGWFFEQWVYGAGHPDFQVDYAWDEDQGVARLTVKQRQEVADGVPVFRMPVLVAFGQPGRRQPIVETIEVGADGRAEEGFGFSLPRRPTWVRFDYENRLLKTLEFDRAEELLINQLHEDEVTGRVEAARQLGRAGSPKGVEALGERLRAKDEFWAVQVAAATALGDARGTEARALLLQALEHPQAKVRAAAAAALGTWRGDDEVGKALAASLQRDKSYMVAAAAAGAIGKVRSRNALTELKRALQRDSYREQVRIKALAGLADLHDEKALPLILEMTAPVHHAFVRWNALESAATLARALGPESRTLVRDAAEQALHDPSYFARRGAVRALEKLGETDAVPALRATIERDVEGQIRYQARVAIERLVRGEAREDELRNLREEVERLRQQDDELRQRLDRISPATAKGGANGKAPAGRTAPVASRKAAGAPAPKAAAKAAAKPAPRPPASRARAGREPARRSR